MISSPRNGSTRNPGLQERKKKKMKMKMKEGKGKKEKKMLSMMAMVQHAPEAAA
jgi:hypothetical protein